MDSKFYISYAAARLLKEKGYNEKCIFAYADTSNGSDINGRIVFNSNDYPIGFYPCPTKSEAIDWLESKGVTISPHPVTIPCEESTTKTHWSCHIVHKDGTWYTTNDLPTRLEAEEAAIIKALGLL